MTYNVFGGTLNLAQSISQSCRHTLLLMLVQVFKSLVRGQQPLDDVVIPNAVYLHTYIIYLRQTYTVERNLLMIEALRASKQGDGKKNRPQDFARLYEIIVQVGAEGDSQLHNLHTGKKILKIG